VAQVLRAGGRTGGLSGGNVLRNGVVVAEVALCFVLLVGSGLMFRSFLTLQRIDPGFDPHGVLIFQTLGAKYASTPEACAAGVRQMEAALTAIPGVKSASATTFLPLSGWLFPFHWGKEDALADPSQFQAVDL
jgi:hypothetical protein